MNDSSLWLVLAFNEPPAGWGFARAASGKCWWRRIEGRGWAAQLGQKLAEQGIHGVCKRVKNNKATRSDRMGLTPIRAVLATLRHFDEAQDALTLSLRTHLPKAGGRRSYDQVHRQAP